MITLIPDRYVPEPVTQQDLIIASLAWGFTLGIGWLASWTAIVQTASVVRRRGWRGVANPYVIMIWGEIAVCLAFGIICFMYLLGAIPPSFAFYFCILTTWALQVQFLLQIIINRCAILWRDKVKINRLKWGVAALITTINITVYCIWIPARLQISDEYVHINEYWDRTEKIIYLLVDGCLNILFIRIVKKNLVDNGLQKYNNLVRFNMLIIGFSLSMDILIISMMSLRNTFVYMQFHPLAYIVKLNIEMSMATLIAKIAKSSGKIQTPNPSPSHTRGFSGNRDTNSTLATVKEESVQKPWATVTKTVELTNVRAPSPPVVATPRLSRANTDSSMSFKDGSLSFLEGHSYSVHIEATPPNKAGPSRDDASSSRRRSTASEGLLE
ncbi:unnamed protein product [Clonostachys byssicola]|uniref:Uncharacterized protein n=1 Tax=Clonostachys byssicola TaxID=160290 RepID=A0A9N9U7R9_9HYPO|nr:unnamed protein product [Clonostachys byssicola]